MNVVRYKREYGSVVAVITKVGHKWAHMVWLDFPVRLRKVRVDELTYTEDLHEDLKATCEAMLDAGTRMGITKGAEDALNGVLASYGREAA